MGRPFQGRLAAVVFIATAGVFPAIAQSAQTVEVVPVQARAVSRVRMLPGEFLPFESVALHAKVTGYVQQVFVDRGSLVKRGQTLVTIEAPELLAQRAEAEAKLAAARSQQTEAQARLVAARNTFDSLSAASKTAGAVAENELVQAQKAVDAQAALVASIEAQAHASAAALDAVKQLENYLKLAAPFDGVITERSVHPGALVGPGGGAMPLLKLEQTQRLRLIVPVPEADVAGIVRGGDVTFTVPAYPGETFRGKVARVAESVDPKTRTMAVELDVQNTDRRLAPGMYPDVQWPVKSTSAALLVPAAAVVTTTERMFVVRVRGGRGQWVDVKRHGAAGPDLVEVIGDLRPGDEVVARASDEIRDGAAVVAKRRVP